MRPDIASKKQEKSLSKKWLKKLPPDTQFVIVDGNNGRGSGRNRLTRKDVIALIENHCTITYKTICIFEGETQGVSSDFITIMYSGKKSNSTTILDYIAFLNAIDSYNKICVITSDLDLAQRVVEEGAKIMHNRVYFSGDNLSSQHIPDKEKVVF
jgi:predicted RNA-binding protein with PIN domain